MMRLLVQCPAPTCKGHVHAIEVGVAATFVIERTCRRCRARWRIIATPVRSIAGGGFVHKLDWTCLEGARS